MKTNEQIAMAGARELRIALGEQIKRYENGGQRPSVYDIQRALDHIISAAEGK